MKKCWAHSPLRAAVTLPFTRCRYCRTPAIAIAQAACDVHDNDNNDNAWQRGPLWLHGMGPMMCDVARTLVWLRRLSRRRMFTDRQRTHHHQHQRWTQCHRTPATRRHSCCWNITYNFIKHSWNKKININYIVHVSPQNIRHTCYNIHDSSLLMIYSREMHKFISVKLTGTSTKCLQKHSASRSIRQKYAKRCLGIIKTANC